MRIICGIAQMMSFSYYASWEATTGTEQGVTVLCELYSFRLILAFVTTAVAIWNKNQILVIAHYNLI